MGIGVALGVVVVAALSWNEVDRHGRAALLLLAFEDPHATVGGVSERETELAGIRARVFETVDPGPPVLLVHGVHPGGMDEPRLVRFARLLADAGFTVATPDIAAMRELRFDPASVEEIARCADAFAEERDAPSVGVVGISIGGGLALRASTRTDAIHAVWAIGAHHDVLDLVDWWTGEPIRGPNGEEPGVEPEGYGAAVIAHAYAEDYFEGDAGAAREALGARLRGETDRARRLRDALPQETRDALSALSDPPARLREIARLHAEELAAVSPAGALSSVTARVFLLHGRDDPLVPSTESLHIAAELPPDRLGGVVLTDLLGHADANPLASWTSKWDVVHLAAGALGSLADPG